ncbi:MAG: carboxypeptidase regulatory-like domain-containing protein [candidate division WOR-3 bacterium]|nr:carboxypeptidase regulatory-like domain-containing protein [candidate division WOR-3 bacterium]
MKWLVLPVVVCVLSANPIMIEVINEFQVAPYDSERVELRYLQSGASDTLFTETFNLYNTEVLTPAGVAYVDTSIFLTGMGQAVIDRSVMTGVFELLDDTGCVAVLSFGQFGDSVYYPGHATEWCCAPAPPIDWSAAKFHCYVYCYYDYEYWLIRDWYLDSTPTPGMPNDDYPGCSVSGHIFDNASQPLAGARVTATFSDYSAFVFPSMLYSTCCTTYTASDGAYYFDSLLPYWYDIDVYADGYLPDTQLIGQLCCTAPINNVNFYLPTGIAENLNYDTNMGSFVRPNPFNGALYVTMREPAQHIDIYDVTGTLIRRFDNKNLNTDVTVDCADLPRGVYFIALQEQKLKVIKF